MFLVKDRICEISSQRRKGSSFGDLARQCDSKEGFKKLMEDFRDQIINDLIDYRY